MCEIGKLTQTSSTAVMAERMVSLTFGTAESEQTVWFLSHLAFFRRNLWICRFKNKSFGHFLAHLGAKSPHFTQRRILLTNHLLALTFRMVLLTFRMVALTQSQISY